MAHSVSIELIVTRKV